MKTGDLVMIKTSWEWLQSNPWMKDTSVFDNRVGIVIEPSIKTGQRGMIRTRCSVMWHTGKIANVRVKRLKVISDQY